MKSLSRIAKAILFCFVLSLVANLSFSQTPTYSLYVTNESQPSPDTYEFEVFLLNTSGVQLELQVISFGLGYDTTILNGGIAAYSIVQSINGDISQPTPSELNYTQAPISLPVGGGVSQNPAYPGVDYRYFNCEARTPPGSGNGSIISVVDSGCAHPGTRIARFRMTNTVPFKPGGTCKHIFSTSVGLNRTNTIVQAYIGGHAVNLTTQNVGLHFNYNSPGTCINQITLDNQSYSNALNESRNTISSYPNPGNQKVIVNSKEQILSFQLLSISGKVVYSNKPLSDKLELDVENFNTGLYFYQAKLIDGSVITGKILIE